MKTFIVYFSGEWLGGTMIVVDETKEKAFDQAKVKLESMGLKEANEGAWFSINNPECMEEIDTTTPNIIVAEVGNY